MKFFQKYPLSFVLLCLFIFVMPFWTRHNILTPYSFSGGGFYEYGTIFIFGSSIILILTLVAWAISLIINKQRPKIGNKQVFGVILTLIILAGISAEGLGPGSVTLRVTAPPVEGAANAACRSFLAALLGIAQSRILIVRGETSRHKLLRIRDADIAKVLARLASHK